MSLIVTAKSGADIEPVPEGLHLAICIGLYDVGTIHSEMFGRDSRKCILQFEFPELPPLESKPRIMSRQFTMSLNAKANLRAFLETWRGRKFTEAELAGFDLEKLLGAPCQLQVMHTVKEDGRTSANITTAIPAPKGVRPVASIKPYLFTVDSLTAPVLPESMQQWVQDLVKTSREWRALTETPKRQRTAAPAAAPPPAEDDDDVFGAVRDAAAEESDPFV
jgi:hypothetical protein